MIAALTVLFAALTCAAPCSCSKGPEVKAARFQFPRLELSRKPQSAPTAVIRAPVRVSLTGFARETVRVPVLRITCLCEIDGMFVCYTGFWCRQNTYERMSGSEISEALRASGLKFTGDEQKRARFDPACFTPFLSSTSKESCSTCVFGNPQDRDRGFFRLSRLAGTARLLLYRCELWQNGGLVGAYESSRAGLGKYDLPEDWHDWKKYPAKFKYAESY